MYFVCTREEDDCKELYGGAWGYYWSRDEAVDAAHRNMTDMHEALYPYAIPVLSVFISIMERKVVVLT